MVFKVAVVLCAALALCSALPWKYSNRYHQSHGVVKVAGSHQSHGVVKVAGSTHQRARIAAPVVKEETCSTASDSSFNIVDGSTAVHVCEFGSFGTCVTPRLPPCCDTPAFQGERIPSNSSQQVKVGDTNYIIRFYIQGVGGCYIAKNEATGEILEFCQPECAPQCTDIPSDACENGILEGTTCEDGVCQCRAGFTGDGCCDCLLEDGFYRPFGTEECAPCECCTTGTAGSVTCDAFGICNCEDGFTGDKCCTDRCECCRDGTVESSNQCDAQGVCNCLPGFIDDKCCNSCECCTTGTVGGSEECDADGICECADGFFGDKCCTPCNCCDDGTDDGSTTCDANGDCGPCIDGRVGDKCCDTCSCCPEGTVSGSSACNADQTCTCKEGYSGDGCCTNDCDCCVDGTVDSSNQCDANGVCNCRPGFSDDKCCDTCDCCTDGTLEGSEECDANGICTCADGFIGDKCCTPCECCTTGTVGNSEACDANGICTCAEGFIGDKCCTACECCTTGTVGNRDECDADGKCTCAPNFTGDKCCTITVPCGDDTDFYFLVDTTESYPNTELCMQSYTMMEIVTALNIGTGPDQSLVGTILYPAPEPSGNTPASYLNELGASDTSDCNSIADRIEALQRDIYAEVFVTSHTPVYPTSGFATLPQNAIKLLAEALDKRPLTGRRIAAIVLTDGQQDVTDLTLEDARAMLPSELDLIAAGYFDPNEANRDELLKDLTIIAGNPNNIVIEESFPALADSLIRLLIQKGIICPDDGQAILDRIGTTFQSALDYCVCISNEFNPRRRMCTNPPLRPQCPSRTFAEAIHGAVKNEGLEEEILAAVEEVLKNRG